MTTTNIFCRVIKSFGGAGPSAEVIGAKSAQPLRAVTKALKSLMLYGLVSRVPGYSAWVYVGSEYSACFYSDPELPPDQLILQRPYLGDLLCSNALFFRTCPD